MDELGAATILDECMPKLRGELLVTGRAIPMGGVITTNAIYDAFQQK
jgi:hypothetical protein